MGRDVSFVELYIDFMLSSGTRTPRNIFDSSQRDKCGFSNYILDDIDTRADAGSIDLFQQNDVWGRSLTWLHKFLPEGLFPANIQRRSHSLTDLGCSAWYRGFDRRPTLTHRLEAAEILHRYFVTTTGTYRNMKRHLDLDLRKPEPHPTWLDIDFNLRLPLMRRAKALFQGVEIWLYSCFIFMSFMLDVRFLTSRISNDVWSSVGKWKKVTVTGWGVDLRSKHHRLKWTIKLFASPFRLLIRVHNFTNLDFQIKRTLKLLFINYLFPRKTNSSPVKNDGWKTFLLKIRLYSGVHFITTSIINIY